MMFNKHSLIYSGSCAGNGDNEAFTSRYNTRYLKTEVEGGLEEGQAGTKIVLKFLRAVNSG